MMSTGSMDEVTGLERRGMKIVQPEGWPRPRGYANGAVASGRYAVFAGQV